MKRLNRPFSASGMSVWIWRGVPESNADKRGWESSTNSLSFRRFSVPFLRRTARAFFGGWVRQAAGTTTAGPCRLRPVPRQTKRGSGNVRFPLFLFLLNLLVYTKLQIFCRFSVIRLVVRQICCKYTIKINMESINNEKYKKNI